MTEFGLSYGVLVVIGSATFGDLAVIMLVALLLGCDIAAIVRRRS